MLGSFQTFTKGTMVGKPPGGTYVVTDSSVIGAGAGSAGVFQAQNNETGETVAIKMIDRSREGASVIAGQRLIADPARRHTVDASWKHSLQRELDIAIKLVHPNIIELKDVVFQDRYVCLVMEHARGGELFQKVAKYGAMTEDLARVYFRQIVAAVIYCHSTGICHRDLKLENCLLAEEGSHLVKIADFGLSKDAEQHSQPRTKRVGTVSYMAPEVVLATGMEPYNGEAADVWSLGVMLYVLLSCEYPFGFDGPGGQPTNQVLSRIKEGAFRFPSNGPLSPQVQDVISGILSIDLGQRLTLENIASHPWFSGDINAPAMGAGSGVSSAAAGGGATAPLSSPVSEPPDAAQKGIDWSQAPELPVELLSASMSVDSGEFEFGDEFDDEDALMR